MGQSSVARSSIDPFRRPPEQAIELDRRHRIGMMMPDLLDLAKHKAQIAHVVQSVRNTPRIFIEIDDGQFHQDANGAG